MLNKQKSKQIKKLRYFGVVPVLIMMVFYASCSKSNSGSDEITEGVQRSDLKVFIVDENAEKDFIRLWEADRFPKFEGTKGNKYDLERLFNQNLKNHYNETFDLNIGMKLNLKPGIYRMIANFIVKSNGRVSVLDVRASNSELAKEAIRVVNDLPKLAPATLNGNPVSVKHYMLFSLEVK